MQCRAALWIFGTFQTSPSTEIKTILDLIPIHFHVKKLYDRFLLRGSSLPSNHIIKSILSTDGSYDYISHNISINNLTPKQRLCLNFPLINMDNRHNKLIPSFSAFDEEFYPSHHLINLFPDCFSFHLHSSNVKYHMKNLDNITFKALSNPLSSIVVSDASIKNHIAMSISHIHLHNKPVIKTIYRAINVTTTEAKLFAIQCSINQVVGITNINHIVIITDFLHATRKIFDSLSHPYQIHSAAIFQELRNFFVKNSNNQIEFCDCPSKQNWPLHLLVDKDSKSFDSVPIFPYKSSWDCCKKQNSDAILSQWRMSFQVSELKGKNFLELLDNNLNLLNCLPVEAVCGCSYLAIPICCALELLEPSSIMPP